MIDPTARRRHPLQRTSRHSFVRSLNMIPSSQRIELFRKFTSPEGVHAVDDQVVSAHPPWGETLGLHFLETPQKKTILHEVLDPTSLSVAFDHICLRSLDTELLFNPKTSFAHACWSDMVQDEAVSLDVYDPGVESFYTYADSFSYVEELEDETLYNASALIRPKSFLFFEPAELFSIRQGGESVGSVPVPVVHREQRSIYRRFLKFYSRIPGIARRMRA
ncbi:hypothetical protein BDZ89DRAFT_415674 [Hymenopellis radicata]|nr:hypothetical protein BDZ89DRAFT_415674 [Hymenopellis radicata]